MYENSRNPSIAKFRTRLEVIRKASRSGLIMAENWNPKGRYFHIQREMIEWFAANEKTAEGFLAFLAPRPRPRHKPADGDGPQMLKDMMRF